MNIKKLVLAFQGMNVLRLQENVKKQGKDKEIHIKILFLYGIFRTLFKSGMKIKKIIPIIKAIYPFVEVVE